MRISTSQFQAVSIGSVLQHQAKLSKTQQHLATGQRILTPADDPVGAARVLDLTASIGELQRLQDNAGMAQTRLGSEEAVLVEVGNLLQRVRELAVQANNDSNSATERRFIAAELRERFEQLVQLANSTDGNGEYLFAGAASREQPFSRTATGVVYNGDQNERMVQVGPTRQLVENHTGFDVFMKVPNGNGTFSTQPAAGNRGTGVIDSGRVLDPEGGAVFPATILFRESASGRLEYAVNGSGDWQPFEPGEAIRFDGIEVTITGVPADGDSFVLERSRPQSVFVTLQNLIDALESGGDNVIDRARVHNAIGRAIADLDQAQENVLRVRAEVGARLYAIEAELDTNENALLELKSAVSKIEDLDYAKAVSEFNLQLVGLQAAQQSYVRIQGLSLFNLL